MKGGNNGGRSEDKGGSGDSNKEEDLICVRNVTINKWNTEMYMFKN